MAILIFVAPRAQKFAVIGDSGIHERCGDQFWQRAGRVDAASISKQKISPTPSFTRSARQANCSPNISPVTSDDKNELNDAVEEG